MERCYCSALHASWVPGAHKWTMGTELELGPGLLLLLLQPREQARQLWQVQRALGTGAPSLLRGSLVLVKRAEGGLKLRTVSGASPVAGIEDTCRLSLVGDQPAVLEDLDLRHLPVLLKDLSNAGIEDIICENAFFSRAHSLPPCTLKLALDVVKIMVSGLIAQARGQGCPIKTAAFFSAHLKSPLPEMTTQDILRLPHFDQQRFGLATAKGAKAESRRRQAQQQQQQQQLLHHYHHQQLHQQQHQQQHQYQHQHQQQHHHQQNKKRQGDQKQRDELVQDRQAHRDSCHPPTVLGKRPLEDGRPLEEHKDHPSKLPRGPEQQALQQQQQQQMPHYLPHPQHESREQATAASLPSFTPTPPTQTQHPALSPSSTRCTAPIFTTEYPVPPLLSCHQPHTVPTTQPPSPTSPCITPLQRPLLSSSATPSTIQPTLPSSATATPSAAHPTRPAHVPAHSAAATQSAVHPTLPAHSAAMPSAARPTLPACSTAATPSAAHPTVPAHSVTATPSAAHPTLPARQKATPQPQPTPSPHLNALPRESPPMHPPHRRSVLTPLTPAAPALKPPHPAQAPHSSCVW